MTILINGQLVPNELIICRDFGFGKVIPEWSKWQKAKYDLIIPMDEFTNAIEKEFDNYVIETKEDDEKYDEIYSKELYELGYPRYAHLIKSNNKSLIAEYIKDLFSSEFLCKLFSNDIKKRYMINSIDNINILDGRVLIEGDAYFPKSDKF